MGDIASLPNLTVEVAFNPTDLTSLTQTWTDITLFVRDFQTHGGRQHYLDRIEASTLSMTLDNRTGFFFNGFVNGTGYVIGTRLPIRISATWNSVTYTVFWGVIDTIDTSLQDALNSDLHISASDTLKYLSLRYLYNTQLYAGLATVSSSSSWYNTANFNSYGDNIGGQNGAIVGDYASVDGVLLYDRTQAVDLTNGGTDNTAYLSIPPSSTYGIEFWVIGQAIQSCTLVPLEDTITNINNFSLKVDASGLPFINGATTYLTQPNNINDGYWHQVAVYVSKPGSNALLNLVVDGVLCQQTILRFGGTAGIEPLGSGNFLIGQNVACQIDQVVQMKQNITLGQIQNRYVAGSLLRKDCNAGDFIAQALVIGGRGSVSGGTISVPNYLVNGSTYTVGSASNGVVLCQGLLSSTTTSSVLDTLFQAVDTEVGVFYQGDDGVLNFHTRAYLYRPAGNAAATYSFTDNMNSMYHYEASSFQLTRDDVDTWTTVIVSPTNGVPQIYENTANELRWGQSTLTKSTTGTTLDAAYQTAVYLGNVFATPLPRINTLKLMSETDNGSNLDAMLGVNLQDRIHVKRTPINPSAAGLTDTDMSLESLNHEFAADPGYWHTTFTLDPYPIRFSTQSSPTYFLVADDATYGKSDIDVAL